MSKVHIRFKKNIYNWDTGAYAPNRRFLRLWGVKYRAFDSVCAYNCVISCVLHVCNITVKHFYLLRLHYNGSVTLQLWRQWKKNSPFPSLSPSFIDLLCLFLSWYREINLIIPSKMYCPICILHLHFQRPVGVRLDWQNPTSQPELSLTQELFSISLSLSGARVWFTGSIWKWRRGNVFVGTWKWRYSNHNGLQLALDLWCQDYLITTLFGTSKLKMVTERANKDETGIFHGGSYPETNSPLNRPVGQVPSGNSTQEFCMGSCAH